MPTNEKEPMGAREVAERCAQIAERVKILDAMAGVKGVTEEAQEIAREIRAYAASLTAKGGG